MSAATKEAPSPASTAAKTAAQANALAAMASANGQAKLAATQIAKPVGAAGVATPETVEPEKKKAPEIDPEEVRFWMKQSVVYVSLFATVVAMACAHWAGKSFLSTALCGATAAILTGIAGTVVAQLSLPQVVAGGTVDEP